MLERKRPLRERARPAGGPPDDTAGDPGLMATVVHWPYSERLPVGSMTIQQIRHRYADRFDIDPLSQAVLDGNEVGDDVVVAPGQLLMFVRRAGEKGLRGGAVVCTAHA